MKKLILTLIASLLTFGAVEAKTIKTSKTKKTTRTTQKITTSSNSRSGGTTTTPKVIGKYDFTGAIDPATLTPDECYIMSKLFYDDGGQQASNCIKYCKSGALRENYPCMAFALHKDFYDEYFDAITEKAKGTMNDKEYKDLIFTGLKLGLKKKDYLCAIALKDVLWGWYPDIVSNEEKKNLNEECNKVIKAEADKGNEIACFYHAQSYNIYKNREEADKYYKISAKKGFPPAIMYMANQASDPYVAIKYYEQLWEMGNFDACNDLEDIYNGKRYEHKDFPNYEKAAEWQKKGKKAGVVRLNGDCD